MPKNTPRILFLTHGDFGNDIAHKLSASYAGSVLDTSKGTHASFWPAADLVISATSTERPQLAQYIDSMAFKWRFAWFSIYMTARDVRCGPLVRPGHSACHWCFRRRRDQHSITEGTPDNTNPRDPDPEFAYPDHATGIAVGFGHQAIREATQPENDESLGGTVRAFSLVDGNTTKSSVLAVNRCARCRPERESTHLWSRFAMIGTADNQPHSPQTSGRSHG